MERIQPLISIIVPIYNVEKYVSECIESIVSQTYKNLQIILVDDGSTDQSGIICDKYAALDGRIKVIHKINGGLVAARKCGLDASTGEYIGFVDGDDSIEPEMYESLLNEMQISKADFVHSGFMQQKERKIPFSKSVIKLLGSEDKERLIKTAIFGSESYLAPSIWSKLFKSELIKYSYNQVPDNAQYGEDLISLCACIANCNRISLLEEAYYHYRYRDNSISNGKEFSSLENLFRYYDNICGILKNYECYEELKIQVMENICNKFLNIVRAVSFNSFQIAMYYFPLPDMIHGKRIIIYGAGAVGRDYYAQISRYMNCRIVAWMDTYPERYQYPYIKVSGLDDLSIMEFDIILIAVKDEDIANNIRSRLMEKGIEKTSIFWSEPGVYRSFWRAERE